MTGDELAQLRALLAKAIDERQLWVGEGLVRVPVVALEYKPKSRAVLLKLGRPG